MWQKAVFLIFQGLTGEAPALGRPIHNESALYSICISTCSERGARGLCRRHLGAGRRGVFCPSGSGHRQTRRTRRAEAAAQYRPDALCRAKPQRGQRQPAARLVVRVYALKDPTSFEQAPFDTFTDPQKEKSTLGADLLSVREVTLIPGQRYSATEKVSREAQALGIVALFRDPAMQRWKFAFDPAKSEKSGIMVGLHNCAMTVTNGTVIAPEQGMPSQPLNMLSSVSCG